MSATHGRRAERTRRNAGGVRTKGATTDDATAASTTYGDAAPTVASRSDPSPTPPAGRARAGLPVRVALGILAALALAVAILAAVNLHAATTFDQATQSLTEHIAAAKADTPDWSKLSTLQEQTDAQFDEAASAEAVLLPNIREAIAANAAVSDQLTELVKRNLAAQQGGDAGNDSAGDSSESNGRDQSSDSSDGGLTDEQRKQVEDLLKANEQSTPSDKGNGTSKESTVTNNTGNTNKPW
ncbi:DUF6466 family protein [Bifidobacterium amazonense]|uniref:DUF6466 family protein n=1 Tax=Bifidobacterium amazonense TaxID=2809027 RepID=A0ABS9VTB6_9BIFI|nr:DUF6466 family protein [Bifidobacterium amazonense]MCH9275327.1 DUF6466 family protein [Bifidobacterium amazonense]